MTRANDPPPTRRSTPTGAVPRHRPTPHRPPPPRPPASPPPPPRPAKAPPPPTTYGQPQPATYGQTQAPPAPQTQCRLCGCVPAAEVTFRGHRGLLVMMQFLHLTGPFCRDCGLATFREMSAKTLIQGWYGYASFVITPITVLINVIRRGKVANLPAPRPPAQGPHGRPMDPGAPLMTRPAALVGLFIPALLEVEHRVGGGGAGPVGDQRAGRAGAQVAEPRLVRLEDVVQDAGTAGLGEELGPEADQRPGRDQPLHPDPAGAVVD